MSEKEGQRMCTPQINIGKPVTVDKKKAEVLNFSASFFSSNFSSHTSRTDELQRWDWGSQVPSTAQEDQIHKHLGTWTQVSL